MCIQESQERLAHLEVLCTCEGEAASMFSGTKTLAHIPSDIDDLKDKKGHIAED